MGGQTWQPKQTEKEAADRQREAAERTASWRASKLYGLISSGGNSAGRIIDWASMPTRR